MSLGLAGMEHGERRRFESEGLGFDVSYQSRQAMGDNNLPAPGYTKGEYTVIGPGDQVRDFPHSPHGPSLMGAKPYAAERAEQHIMDHWSKAKMGRLFNDRRKS